MNFIIGLLLQYVASVGCAYSDNNINKQLKFCSLPKRYNKIRRFDQKPFARSTLILEGPLALSEI
jgi:hypothetical protein